MTISILNKELEAEVRMRSDNFPSKPSKARFVETILKRAFLMNDQELIAWISDPSPGTEDFETWTE